MRLGRRNGLVKSGEEGGKHEGLGWSEEEGE